MSKFYLRYVKLRFPTSGLCQKSATAHEIKLKVNVNFMKHLELCKHSTLQIYKKDGAIL